jgi:catechol 2,3-dioxygenase-like lactoylglutathione lyase family enzyme
MAIAPVSGLVPMIHVADVERSAEFYRLLGFAIGNYVPHGGSRMEWAWLYAPNADDWKRGPNLMLTRASEPVDPRAQAVLFYLYAVDLNGLRQHLLDNEIAAGEITFPEYLPNGEFRLVDPDGYVLMIAQSVGDTP